MKRRLVVLGIMVMMAFGSIVSVSCETVNEKKPVWGEYDFPSPTNDGHKVLDVLIQRMLEEGSPEILSSAARDCYGNFYFITNYPVAQKSPITNRYCEAGLQITPGGGVPDVAGCIETLAHYYGVEEAKKRVLADRNGIAWLLDQPSKREDLFNGTSSMDLLLEKGRGQFRGSQNVDAYIAEGFARFDAVYNPDGTRKDALGLPVADETFDAAYYAANNPDVVAAFGNDPAALKLHYDTFGKAEGRKAHE